MDNKIFSITNRSKQFVVTQLDHVFKFSVKVEAMNKIVCLKSLTEYTPIENDVRYI